MISDQYGMLIQVHYIRVYGRYGVWLTVFNPKATGSLAAWSYPHRILDYYNWNFGHSHTYNTYWDDQPLIKQLGEIKSS